MAENVEKKPGVFKKIGRFFGDYTGELKKIVWPTQKTVWRNTGIVLLMIFIMGVFVAALDWGLVSALGKFMSVSPRNNISAVPADMTSISEQMSAVEMPEQITEQVQE